MIIQFPPGFAAKPFRVTPTFRPNRVSPGVAVVPNLSDRRFRPVGCLWILEKWFERFAFEIIRRAQPAEVSESEIKINQFDGFGGYFSFGQSGSRVGKHL